ncbi:MAG: hypothetical protein WC838_04430, partial [Candidatus Margulisiibacteriota bacterium]
MLKKTLSGIILLSMLTISALAVPTQLTYSGRLLQNGALVNSTLTMTFKIYNDPTSVLAGNLLWSTSNISVPVNQGIYSVALDQVSPNVFSGDQAYLEVIIDPAGTPETLAPRTKINSVGYALQAGGLSKIGGGQAVVVSTNGYIGIGTTNPQAPISLGSSATPGGPYLLLFDTNNGVNVGLFRDTPASNVTAFAVNNLGQLVFGKTTTNPTPNFGTEWMRITNAGNVGIGTNGPDSKLVVSDNVQQVMSLISSYPIAPSLAAHIVFKNSNGDITGRLGSYHEGSNLTGLVFHTRSSAGNINERMRISATGLVGIGTPTPNA